MNIKKINKVNYKKPKQASFAQLSEKIALSFGGDVFEKSNPNSKRPLDSKKGLHLVLRMSPKFERSDKFYTQYSFQLRAKKIKALIHRYARLNNLQIIELAVLTNHIHIGLKFLCRGPVLTHKYYARFIRALSGMIARISLEAERGSKFFKPLFSLNEQRQRKFSKNEQSKKNTNFSRGTSMYRENFWLGRPFTRVVELGQALLALLKYIRLNQIEEATGFTKSQARLALELGYPPGCFG